ncbi:MAG: RNA polymerase sigma factor [Cytophagales bacterium]
MAIKHNVVKENEILIDLWNKSKSGDEKAFGKLAQSQYRILFKHAYNNFSKDTDFIKDAIQDLYFHIWVNRKTIEMQYISIYLVRALRNNLISKFRVSDKKNRNFVSFDFEEVEEVSNDFGAENAIILEESQSENERKIRQLIETLPLRQQEVVRLKYFDGLDNLKIAQKMGLNKQSVANLLHKALHSLKLSLPTLFFLLLVIFGEMPLSSFFK